MRREKPEKSPAKMTPRFWAQCALQEMTAAPLRMIDKGVSRGWPREEIQKEFESLLAEWTASAMRKMKGE